MNATSPTLLILRCRARLTYRWIGAHGFEIFCLSPIIVGGVLWVLDRQLSHLREPLARYLAGTGESPGAASLAAALLLVAIALPATWRELYGDRRAGGHLDALPVPTAARFRVSLAVELARILPVFGVLLLAAGALAGELLPPATALAERCGRLLAALIVLALGRFAATLLLAHFQTLARGWWLVAAALASVALAAPASVRGWLLLPWLAPAAQLQTVFSNALGVPPDGGPAVGAAGPWALASTAGVLYGLCHAGYLAWHRHDLEAAARVASNGSSGGTHAAWKRPWAWRLPAVFSRGGSVAVQVGRDLALVLRRFSQAVPLAAGIALLLDAAVLTMLADGRMPDLWRQRLAVTGLALSVLAVVALVPFLLKHQLPRFWIEKSIGVDFEQIWQAKLWTAALLATAPALAGIGILFAAPLDAGTRGSAILQFLAAAWIVTSIVALAVFEIAAQPLLGLLFGSLLGLALSALFVFYPQAWWLWTALYVYVAGQIAGRATRRVRLLEIAP